MNSQTINNGNSCLIVKLGKNKLELKYYEVIMKLELFVG